MSKILSSREFIKKAEFVNIKSLLSGADTDESSTDNTGGGGDDDEGPGDQ